MPDGRDIVDIAGLARGSSGAGGSPRSDAGAARGRPFLSIWFRCCHVYSRVYRNRAGTAYEGRCPGCAAPLDVPIGPGGTDRRMFEAE